MEIKTSYIRYAKNLTDNGYKLICIPYAGSGASVYARWQKEIGKEIEILPVQLPGRENRMSEECILSCKEAAEKIGKELFPYVESENFSIFGHSMGGIIAYETVKYFERNGKKPDVCFVSSTSIEDMSNMKKSTELNDDDFFKRVSDFGTIDTESEILKFPEFKSIFMNILRADFNIIETYEDDGYKINSPIVASCGDNDPMETLLNMESWKNYTSSGVEFCQYRGDHFYLNNNLDELIKMIRTKINLIKSKADN